MEQHSLIPLCRSIAKDDRPCCTSHQLRSSRPRCIDRSTSLRKMETMPAHNASIIIFGQGLHKISSSLAHKNKTIQELRFSFDLQTALNMSLRRGRGVPYSSPEAMSLQLEANLEGPVPFQGASDQLTCRVSDCSLGCLAQDEILVREMNDATAHAGQATFLCCSL